MTPFENYLDKHPIIAIIFFFFYAWFIGQIVLNTAKALFRSAKPEDLMSDIEKTRYEAFKRFEQQGLVNKENN